MRLSYRPEGSDEAQTWAYDPKKLRSLERELIERETGMAFGQFTVMVIRSHALCRRVLLWVFLRRDHPKLRLSDVDFAWDELTLEYCTAEYADMIDKAYEAEAAGDRGPDALPIARVVAALEAEMVTAYDYEAPVTLGKALASNAESSISA